MSESLTREQLEQLRKPFPAKSISFKCQTKPNEKGNSLVVAYIDARDVMDRLDDVVGPDWGDRYEKSGTAKGLVCYLTVAGVTRADVGDDDNDNEATKSAYSDAFKRAAVKFGIGRFLYDLPKMWAKAKPMGKSFILEDGEIERLRRGVDEFLAGGKKQSAPTSTASQGPRATATTTIAATPTASAKAAVTEHKVTATKAEKPASQASLMEVLKKQHAELWAKAGTARLLTQQNVDLWSLSTSSTDAEVRAKIRLLQAAVMAARAQAAVATP
jgi:hypothetical protein